MPRNVRNFWIELKVDGREGKVATGPVGKDGGFQLAVGMREEGGISNHVIHIDGQVYDNTVRLHVQHHEGKTVVDELEDIVLDR